MVTEKKKTQKKQPVRKILIIEKITPGGTYKYYIILHRSLLLALYDKQIVKTVEKLFELNSLNPSKRAVLKNQPMFFSQIDKNVLQHQISQHYFHIKVTTLSLLEIIVVLFRI